MTPLSLWQSSRDTIELIWEQASLNSGSPDLLLKCLPLHIGCNGRRLCQLQLFVKSTALEIEHLGPIEFSDRWGHDEPPRCLEQRPGAHLGRGCHRVGPFQRRCLVCGPHGVHLGQYPVPVAHADAASRFLQQALTIPQDYDELWVGGWVAFICANMKPYIRI